MGCDGFKPKLSEDAGVVRRYGEPSWGKGTAGLSGSQGSYAVKESFKSPKPEARRLKTALLGGPGGAGSRDGGGEREGPDQHQPPPRQVPGNAGGRGTELSQKPGEAGVLLWGSWGP